MSSLITDPDVKINMSLDEIISLSRDQNYNRFPKRYRGRRKNNFKSTSSHSVALLSSTCGVGIYVSKKSTLLNPENRRRFIQAVSNRTINSDIIQKSRQIIPAEYKLVKTYNGVERILVPVPEYITKLQGTQSETNETCVCKTFPEKPPPLRSVPILNHPKQSNPDTEMEVDEDDEVVILSQPKTSKKLEVIDLESDLSVEVTGAKNTVGSLPQKERKTLSDRFTMLRGSFQF